LAQSARESKRTGPGEQEDWAKGSRNWARESRKTWPGKQEDWAKGSLQVLGHGKEEDWSKGTRGLGPEEQGNWARGTRGLGQGEQEDWDIWSKDWASGSRIMWCIEGGLGQEDQGLGQGEQGIGHGEQGLGQVEQWDWAWSRRIVPGAGGLCLELKTWLGACGHEDLYSKIRQNTALYSTVYAYSTPVGTRQMYIHIEKSTLQNNIEKHSITNI
jgi:hypothetical protein